METKQDEEPIGINCTAEDYVRKGGKKSLPRPSDFGLQDRHACLDTCVDRFVAQRLPPGGSFWDVCQALSQNEPNKDLWNLYCCDSSYCGVRVEEKPTGQSPGVDLVINLCLSHGYNSIYDPGYQPDTFTCTAADEKFEPMELSCASDVTPSSKLPPTTSAQEVTGVTILGTQGFTTTTTMATSTATRSISPSLTGIGVSSTEREKATETPTSSTAVGLTGPSKAAIIVCSIVGVAALLVLLSLFRKRKERTRNYERTSSMSTRPSRPFSHTPTHSGSNTPLITSPPSARIETQTPPPPRLGDRRFIVSPTSRHNSLDDQMLANYGSGVIGTDHPSGQSTPRQIIRGHSRMHPKSPLSSPPRTMTHYLGNTSASSLSSVPEAVAAVSAVPGATAITAPSPTASPPQSQSPYFTMFPGSTAATPPLSPPRPPRPHEAPLEIPDLVRPSSQQQQTQLQQPPLHYRQQQQQPRAPTSPRSFPLVSLLPPPSSPPPTQPLPSPVRLQPVSTMKHQDSNSNSNSNIQKNPDPSTSLPNQPLLSRSDTHNDNPSAATVSPCASSSSSQTQKQTQKYPYPPPSPSRESSSSCSGDSFSYAQYYSRHQGETQQQLQSNHPYKQQPSSDPSTPHPAILDRATAETSVAADGRESWGSWSGGNNHSRKFWRAGGGGGGDEKTAGEEGVNHQNPQEQLLQKVVTGKKEEDEGDEVTGTGEGEGSSTKRGWRRLRKRRKDGKGKGKGRMVLK